MRNFSLKTAKRRPHSKAFRSRAIIFLRQTDDDDAGDACDGRLFFLFVSFRIVSLSVSDQVSVCLEKLQFGGFRAIVVA